MIAASNLLVIVLPIRPLTDETVRGTRHMLLQEDYLDAFDWLKDNTGSGDVILASPDVSLWIPPQTGARVVYTHPQQTIQPAAKKLAVLSWYRETDPSGCQSLLQGEISYTGSYTVSYVLVGPKEEEIGESICLHVLDLVQSFGVVQIYAYVPPAPPPPDV